MSKYIVISNFKGGLDSRRLDTEQLPGTLSTLVDAHINQGGEIEKRKAFSLFATLPANVFGLEVTTAGLISFGSISPPAMPAGITYQRLQDPAGGNFAYYINSVQFAGKAFVLANFDTTLTWAFYDGTVVAESVNGKVLTTNQTTLAQNLANLIAALPGFFVSAVVTGGGIASFTFWSQTGVNFNVVLEMAAGSTGLVSAKQIYAAVPQIPNIAATGGFQITGGSTAGAGTITSVKVNGVEVYNTSGTVPPFPYNDSAGTGPAFDAPNNAQTASDLVYKLNLGISTPAYSFIATQNMITIADNSNAGAAANGFVVRVTCTGDMMLDDATFKITGSVAGDTCTAVNAGATALLSGVVNRPAGPTDTAHDILFAQAIVANIVAFHATSGYTAYNPAGTTTIRVSKLLRNSNDAVPANLAITTTGTAGTISAGISGSTATGVSLGVTVSPLFDQLPTVARGKVSTSDLITALASGGNPPYTYSWAMQNASNGGWVVNAPNAASTTFSCPNNQAGASFTNFNGYAVCTVTDTASVIVKTKTVQLSLQGR